jgi:hypothetical protein
VLRTCGSIMVVCRSAGTAERTDWRFCTHFTAYAWRYCNCLYRERTDALADFNEDLQCGQKHR